MKQIAHCAVIIARQEDTLPPQNGLNRILDINRYYEPNIAARAAFLQTREKQGVAENNTGQQKQLRNGR